MGRGKLKRNHSRNKSKKKNSGQAVIEYILLLAMILGAVGFVVSNLRNGTDKMTAISGAKLEKLLRTGSAPPSIWSK